MSMRLVSIATDDGTGRAESRTLPMRLNWLHRIDPLRSFLTVAAIIRRIRRPTSGMVSGSWSRSSHHRVRRGVVVTKLDLLRIVDQIGEKAVGCVALRKGVRRALLELRLYRYQRRAAARRERAIRRPRSRKTNPIRLEALTASIGESRYSQ